MILWLVFSSELFRILDLRKILVTFVSRNFKIISDSRTTITFFLSYISQFKEGVWYMCKWSTLCFMFQLYYAILHGMNTNTMNMFSYAGDMHNFKKNHKTVIKELNFSIACGSEVDVLGCWWNKHFSEAPKEEWDMEKGFICVTTFLWFQSPLPHKLVLEKMPLGSAEPETGPVSRTSGNGAARHGAASKLIKVH